MAITILSLDTSSQYASISLLKDEQTVFEYNFSSDDNLSAILIPSLEFLLKSVHVKLEDIDAFGIGIGPGMFTGLRVGLATLKGLNMMLVKPVVPVVTLEALAYKCRDTKRPIVSLVDAKRNEVYFGVYQSNGQSLEEIAPPQLMLFADIFAALQQWKELIFVGTGADVYKSKIKAHYKNVKLYTRSYFLASEIGKIALERFNQGIFITDMQQLLPLYLRKPDAEIKIKSALADRKAI